jgi:hypothetical protein
MPLARPPRRDLPESLALGPKGPAGPLSEGGRRPPLGARKEPERRAARFEGRGRYGLRTPLRWCLHAHAQSSPGASESASAVATRDRLRTLGGLNCGRPALASRLLLEGASGRRVAPPGVAASGPTRDKRRFFARLHPYPAHSRTPPANFRRSSSHTNTRGRCTMYLLRRVLRGGKDAEQR